MTVDLTSTWLGLELKNPLVASSSPLTGDLDRMREFERAGVAAIVLPSLFEEQIEHDEMEVARLHEHGSGGFAEALDFFPELPSYGVGPDAHLERLSAARSALSIPVIASLNGHSPGGWIRYAKLLEEAGASALELNIYDLPTDPEQSAEDVESRYLELVRQVSEAIELPISVKIGPYFSSLVHMARRFEGSGAKGLTLFNRFMQPDIDLETLTVTPNLQLSVSWESRLPLRWIAILRGRVGLSLAATTGVHDAESMVKLLLAGADVTMVTSAFLRHGPGYAKVLVDGLREWLETHEYESVEQLKGSMSQLHAPDPEQFERANYMRALTTFTPRDH